ncbi:hypothetical protein HDV05_002600, partial [Chytridiales sp. JEL 0842]
MVTYHVLLDATTSEAIPVTTQDADLFWDLINQEESPKHLRETVLPTVFNSTNLANALAAVNYHLGFPHPQAGRLLALKKFIAPFDKIHMVIELGQCPVLDIYGFSSTTSFSGKVFEGIKQAVISTLYPSESCLHQVVDRTTVVPRNWASRFHEMNALVDFAFERSWYCYAKTTRSQASETQRQCQPGLYGSNGFDGGKREDQRQRGIRRECFAALFDISAALALKVSPKVKLIHVNALGWEAARASSLPARMPSGKSKIKVERRSKALSCMTSTTPHPAAIHHYLKLTGNPDAIPRASSNDSEEVRKTDKLVGKYICSYVTRMVKNALFYSADEYPEDVRLYLIFAEMKRSGSPMARSLAFPESSTLALRMADKDPLKLLSKSRERYDLNPVFPSRSDVAELVKSDVFQQLTRPYVETLSRRPEPKNKAYIPVTLTVMGQDVNPAQYGNLCRMISQASVQVRAFCYGVHGILKKSDARRKARNAPLKHLLLDAAAHALHEAISLTKNQSVHVSKGILTFRNPNASDATKNLTGVKEVFCVFYKDRPHWTIIPVMAVSKSDASFAYQTHTTAKTMCARRILSENRAMLVDIVTGEAFWGPLFPRTSRCLVPDNNVEDDLPEVSVYQHAKQLLTLSELKDPSRLEAASLGSAGVLGGNIFLMRDSLMFSLRTGGGEQEVIIPDRLLQETCRPLIASSLGSLPFLAVSADVVDLVVSLVKASSVHRSKAEGRLPDLEDLLPGLVSDERKHKRYICWPKAVFNPPVPGNAMFGPPVLNM